MSEWVLIIVLVTVPSASYRGKTVAIDHIPMATESACKAAQESVVAKIKDLASGWSISCVRTGDRHE